MIENVFKFETKKYFFSKRKHQKKSITFCLKNQKPLIKKHKIDGL